MRVNDLMQVPNRVISHLRNGGDTWIHGNNIRTMESHCAASIFKYFIQMTT